MQASLFIKTDCTLGEAPMWHAERKSIWWVDINEGHFFECDIATKNIHCWKIPQQLSLLVQAESDKSCIVIAVEDGLLKFDIEKNDFERILYLEHDVTENRTNDGACDANGRLWLGTMHSDCKAGAGKLYCIEDNTKVQGKIEQTTISNGLCWSLQNDRMYYIDSATYKVQSYFFDPLTAQIIFDKTIIDIPRDFGMPDGMTIDVEGMLWIAQWGGFCVKRWNPENGELLNTIELPVPNVTSCVFGGENLDQLFITTARAGLSPEELEKYPLSGSVFVAPLKIRGVSAKKFRV